MSFVRPRELMSFDQQDMTRSPPIGITCNISSGRLMGVDKESYHLPSEQPALTGVTVLYYKARQVTLTVPLSTQVYKWVLEKLMLGVTLAVDILPIHGGDTASHLILQKLQ